MANPLDPVIANIISRLDALDGGIPQIPTKFCVDCKHYGGMAKGLYSSVEEHQCNCPGVPNTHPVTGELYTDHLSDRAADQMRWDKKKCGMAAKWFEPK